MQVLLDLFPVIAFVGTYWIAGFKAATVVIMLAMVAQALLTWLILRKVNRMFLASTVLVVGLGGISLLLKNDLIFKWKPTVLNWFFALAFLVSTYVGEIPLIQRLLQSVAKEELTLAREDWRTLNIMWVFYFLVAGAANIFVAYRFSEAVWVNFKLFGLFGLTILFLLLQAWWLSNRLGSASPAPPTDAK
jgi:intracellular septation protein